ncbi:ABC transporter substrate-binding protein [Flexivirga sp. ID2601S]|uniref:ABC transporter substrate-binding protein n=1 Tax=Flexivirga aerilata TaxID=1656889 RepID=A0A849ANJ8_9MICO|nr:ABC transporter substrate-binding protein [Flexivirga aerilata]NNG40888.1 ABC transporter substrate-binding protein [Flexivirga aerilata]
MPLTSRIVALPTAVLALSAVAACASAGSTGAGVTGSSGATPKSSGGMKAGGGGMNMSAAPACTPVPKPAAAPRRIVTMDAGAAAFVQRLGAGDRLVGTAAPDFRSAFTGEARAALDTVRVIDPGRGNREAVLAAKPDLVTGISVYELDSFDGNPTADQLRQNGIAAYVACPSTSPVTDLTPTYKYVNDLAAVIGRPSAGSQVLAQLTQQAGHRSGDTPVVALSAAPTGGQGISTRGSTSLANGIITLAGGRNIASSVRSDLAQLSAEQVSVANPKVIVAVSGLGPQTGSELVEAITASPLLQSTEAVRSGNVVVVPQSILLSPSLLNSQAVSTIADAVAKAK